MGRGGAFAVSTVRSVWPQPDLPVARLIWQRDITICANNLNIPGEDLTKVFHYYHDPHPYFDQDVLVIGGKNSAAIAALELWRHGARVTLVHRGAAMHKHVKYWILPDIDNRIAHEKSWLL